VFRECSDLEGTEDLGQGDVLEWVPSGTDPWRQFGIIVTADCDLAYDKHAGILSYVPVLCLPDYLRLFYFPRRLESELAKAFVRTSTLIRSLQRELRPNTDPALDDAVNQLLSRPPRATADALQAAGDRRAKLLSEIAAYQQCRQALESRDHDAEIAAFVATRVAQGVNEAAARNSLMKDVQTVVCSLPGDGLFLGALSEDHREGYVAYLRLIRETAAPVIALRQPHLSKEGIQARRISRLQSPYVYHLTQRLSSVFAAIGLPTEYEEHRATLLVDQYAPEA
jgi:hypothetical protein